jgi:hypothetical protein
MTALQRRDRIEGRRYTVESDYREKDGLDSVS